MADEKIYTNIGHATAYAYAKSKGYTGTEDQFATDQANFAANAQQVREDKESVETTVATFGNTTVPAAVQTVTAEGTRQVGIVGTAGDTQVGVVQTEGTTQKNAVQAKGNEVIASIPSDYTELTEEVEDLKSSIDGKLLSTGVKSAILNCFRCVAWVDDEKGNEAYNNLVSVFDGDTYAIVNNLKNCETSNNATSITRGGSYVATITSVSDYALSTAEITIMMGTEDITSSAYNNGVINIPSVTGELVITIIVADGYTLYDYIVQTSNVPSDNGIITDIACSTDYTFETDLYYTNTIDQSPRCMLGERNGLGTKYFALFVQPSTSKLAYWFNGTDSATLITGFNANQHNKVIVKPVGSSETYPDNAIIYLNGAEYNTESESTGVTWQPWLTFYGYGKSATTSSDTANLGLHIGETIIKSNNNIIYDLVPANNGEYNGLYDVVNDKFYHSTNTALFICGNWGV